MKTLMLHNDNVMGLVGKLIKDGKTPYLMRTGSNGAFFELLGRPISSIYQALAIEKVLAKHRISRSWRPGWCSILSLPMLASRLPKFDVRTDKFHCACSGQELDAFNGVCSIDNSEHYFFTWLEGDVRYWRVASAQEISVEYRRC
ncbi:hypothetical protein ACSN2V_004005 [Vibrio parahaemolyticus]|nr:hypothetical protein [Vibrio parahaemolyticus]MDF4642077.1 hypothetical protein [Vibrio parahaemolyticus]HAS3040285.1 hypothetical protein [Vibrio parahaemolyticus]HCG6159558.1 hypothetical protein [Vibrio parahaemolyticus]HCG6858497.1 hypothetical protein [Vibrio parahaemolyticus]